jgi:hypothetical protein
MREVRRSKNNRDRQVVMKMRVWCGNKYLTHTKMKARSPHDKTSILKMRFLDAVIAPVMRMMEKKRLVRNFKEPTCPIG